MFNNLEYVIVWHLSSPSRARLKEFYCTAWQSSWGNYVQDIVLSLLMQQRIFITSAWYFSHDHIQMEQVLHLPYEQFNQNSKSDAFMTWFQQQIHYMPRCCINLSQHRQNFAVNNTWFVYKFFSPSQLWSCFQVEHMIQ